MKYCGTCEQEKNESEFGKRKASKDGLSHRCKVCQRVYDKLRAGDDARKEQRAIYAQTEGGKISGNKAKAKWRKDNPNKYKAHYMVSRAIANKKLFREQCSCGSLLDTHAHHNDYAKPLNVTWLCASCHSQWHRDNGEGLNP